MSDKTWYPWCATGMLLSAPHSLLTNMKMILNISLPAQLYLAASRVSFKCQAEHNVSFIKVCPWVQHVNILLVWQWTWWDTSFGSYAWLYQQSYCRNAVVLHPIFYHKWNDIACKFHYFQADREWPKVIFLLFRQCQQYIIDTYLKEGNVHDTVKQEKHIIHKDSIAMAEPLMVNPNLYERVKEVLEHIKKTYNWAQQKMDCGGVRWGSIHSRSKTKGWSCFAPRSVTGSWAWPFRTEHSACHI